MNKTAWIDSVPYTQTIHNKLMKILEHCLLHKLHKHIKPQEFAQNLANETIKGISKYIVWLLRKNTIWYL